MNRMLEDSGPAAPVARRRPHASLPQMLRQRARGADAARPALLAPGRPVLSYAALHRQVTAHAAVLAGCGLTARDRVALALPNGPELAAAVLAVSSIAACAPLDPGLTLSEWQRYLRTLGVTALLAPAGGGGPAVAAAQALGLRVLGLRSLPDGPAGAFALAVDAPAPAGRPQLAGGGDDAFVLPTSGTTGQPKAVPLSHDNVCWSAHHTGLALALGPGDLLLNMLPLHHAHGLISGLLSSLAAGAAVVCTPGYDAARFATWMAEFEPTWLTAVPALYEAILAGDAGRTALAAAPRLRLLRSASAPLPQSVLRRLEAVAGVPVIETYGMTEAASQIASNPLPPGRRKLGSVGRAAGAEIAILDAVGRPRPAGHAGEIGLRGRNLTRGYADGADAAAATTPDGWFRTGDRGHLDGDGYLFIEGSIREAINRGGQTIAPREVEHALLQHPDVVRAAVFAISHRRLGEDVAAAVVLRPGATVTPRTLRRAAAELLAASKLPRRILVVPALPTGPTGKLQRLQLARRLGLDGAGRARRRDPPPHGEAERQLADIWAAALGRADVAVDDDFFELGGDSLAATQILSRVGVVFGRELAFADLLEASTVARLAARIARAGKAPDVAPVPGAAATGGHGWPLSAQQARLYFLERLGAAGHGYNVLEVLRLDGPLDRAALGRSLAALVARHEILHTSFVERDGVPVAVPGAAPASVLHCVARPAADEAELAAAIHDHARAAVTRRFDLAAPPLLRASLLCFGGARHALVLTMHHLLTDGWSSRLFWQELAALYRAQAGGRDAALPPSRRYAELAPRQQAWLRTPAATRQRAYWSRQLAGLTVQPLRADGARDAAAPPAGARHDVAFSRVLTRRLKGLARRRRATQFMVVLAALQCLLQRHTGSDDIAVGSLFANRGALDSEALLGPLANTVVLRTDLSGDPGFAALLDRVRRTVLAAHRNQALPFEAVLQALQLPRSPERNPLFQVMFILHNGTAPPPALPGVSARFVDVDPGSARFDLTLELSEQDGRLAGWFEYRRDVFAAATVARIAAQLRVLLAGAVADPALPLSRLPVLPPRERRRLLVRWNDTARPLPPSTSLHAGFARSAARWPERLALRCGEERLSFAQLERRANRLANHLRRRGVRPGDLVGLSLPRGTGMVTGLLGILKAGAAYVPLDPDYPPQRLALMLQDADPRLLVTAAQTTGLFAGRGRDIVCLDADGPAIDAEPATAPDDHAMAADGRAYVLFTSGSSGRPKGVLCSQRGAMNGIGWLCRTFPFDSGEVSIHRTSLNFGDSIQELFAPLLNGVPVVVAGAGVAADPAALVALLADSGATRVVLVPSLLRAVLDACPDAAGRLPALRLWISSGEALSADLARRFVDALPDRRLVNIYGASEMSDIVTWHEVGARDTARHEAGARNPPIGRPVDNMRVYVLDATLNPVPVGVPGELCVAGTGLSAGYLGNPALTAEKFVPMPFADGGDGPLYRTGDRAMFRADGCLDYLGRMDAQLQVRGCRIEPGEVEAALRGRHGVAEVAVDARAHGADELRLVAYVVPTPGATLEVDALHAAARQRLPDYMLPSGYAVLAALPLTPNGKLDRQALRQIPPDRPAGAAGRAAAPGGTAAQLAEIWRRLLEVEAIGLHDNFFALGGHSLLAGRLLGEVDRRFGVKLPLRAIFDAPTVAELGRRIDGAASPADAEPEPAMPPVDTGQPLRVSISQQSLLAAERALPGLPFFNVPYRFRLTGDLDAQRLARSLEAVVRRHPLLRTRFGRADGGDVLLTDEPAALSSPLAMDDLRGADDTARAALQAASAEAWRPFRLDDGPGFRARLLRLEDHVHVLLLTFHHIIVDGWSVRLFLRELSQFYDHPLSDPAVAPAASATEFAAFAQWQRRWCEGAQADAQLAGWRDRLHGAVPLFPLPDGAPPGRNVRIERQPFELPGALVRALAAVAYRENATLFMALLAGFKLTLRAATGQRDLCVTTMLANRAAPEREHLFGPLDNQAIVRTRFDGDATFPAMLAQVREAVLAADAVQELPFEVLVERCAGDAALPLEALSQVAFVCQNQTRCSLRLAGVEAAGFGDLYREGQPVLPLPDVALALTLNERPAGITGNCVYDRNRLAPEALRRLLRDYAAVLGHAALAPEASYGELKEMVAGQFMHAT